jgi:hypothetical protein
VQVKTSNQLRQASVEYSNCDLLYKHEPLFLQLGLSAEKLFSFNPNSSLLKPRHLDEVMISTRCGNGLGQDEGAQFHGFEGPLHPRQSAAQPLPQGGERLVSNKHWHYSSSRKDNSTFA